MAPTIPTIEAIVDACVGQQVVAETEKGKIPMTPEEEEEHARRKRVTCAYSMAIEGTHDLEEAIYQLQIVAQRNKEMMLVGTNYCIGCWYMN